MAFAALMLSTTLVSACSSAGGRPSAAGAATQAEPARSAEADPFAIAAPSPVEIQSIELHEGAPGIDLDVKASGAMVWTSYRAANGDLIVELPNSSPSPKLKNLEQPNGLVASVRVDADTSGNRPVTRLTISTRAEAEHALAADGRVLRLSLVPTGDAVAAAAPEPAKAPETERFVYEPLTSENGAAEPVRPTAEPGPSAHADLADLGTAENPRPGAPPTGPLASSLREIEVLNGDTILVAGDGDFTFSTFRLENPERFVIDLAGVVNTADSSSMPVGNDRVRRVRVAQFKPFPEPVTRVVLDLDRPQRPTIERTTNGLRIRLDDLVASVPPSIPEPVVIATAEPRVETPPMAEPEPVHEAAVVPAPTYAAPAYEAPANEEPVYEEPVAVAAVAPAPVYQEPEPPVEELPEPMRLEEPMAAEPMPMPVKAEAPRMAQAEPMPAPRRLDEPLPVPVEATGYVSEPARRAPQIPASNDSELFSTLPPQDGAGDFSARVFDAKPFGVEEKAYTGAPISMSLRDADVVETLRSFASISELSIVVQPSVAGRVTVELENVPWDQALEQILKINNLGYEIEGTIMRIAPLNTLRAEAEQKAALAQAKADQIPMQTIVKRLSYSSANDIATLLRQGGGLLSRRGSVIVDARTNTLILKELPQFMDTVIAVIEEIDTPEPQVMIEARIIETTKRFTRTLGVAWSVGGEASARFGNTTGLQFPNNVSGAGGVNLLTGGQNGIINLSLGNVLNSFTLDAQLQAAEAEGLIKILSAPKIATLNNERANIQSGLQIPVQTISNNTVTVQFINATLSLEVTPQVTAEGTVLMDIEIRKREPQLAFAVQGAANAPIATKEARTRVIVRDGGTTVIGGIYEVSSDQGEDRVPGLANIPLLGHLFKNRRRSDENEELLIFITPRVINL